MLTPGKDVRDFINNNRHTTVEKGAVISTLHNADLTNIKRFSEKKDFPRINKSELNQCSQ